MEKDKHLSLARIVKQATKYDLKAYCEIRGLSLTSLYKGYVSKKNKKDPRSRRDKGGLRCG